MNPDASPFCPAPGNGPGEPRVAASPQWAILVALAGTPDRVAPSLPRAIPSAIALPAVAAATDHGLACGSPRRRTAAPTPPSAWNANTPGGRAPRLPGYWLCIRARHGVGHGVELNRQVQISAPCLPSREPSLTHQRPPVSLRPMPPDASDPTWHTPITEPSF